MTGDDTRLRILCVEDSKTDFLLIMRELARESLEADCVRVYTAAGLGDALATKPWDVVLSDFTMATLDGFEALAMARAHDPDLPFILISGTVGEDVAVEAMKRGADDYVMKGNLTRLAPAVRRALRDAGARRDRRLLEDALRRSEANFRDLITHAADGFFVCTREGNLLIANARYCEIVGYPEGELLRRSVLDLVPAEEREQSLARLARLAGSEGMRFEQTLLRRDGAAVIVEVSMRLIGENIQGIVRDVTERRRAEEQVHRLNRVYAVLSGINALVVRVRNRDQLFRGACRIAVEVGGFRMAWIGVADRAAGVIRPAAHAGGADQLLAAIQPRLALDDAASPGIAAEVYRTRRATVLGDLQGDARVKSAALHAQLGNRSMAIFPLMVGPQPVALFALYSAEPGFFDEEEMGLLDELAIDVGFALDHIEKLDQLDQFAYFDDVTQLPNRHQFQSRLSDAVAGAASESRRMAVGILDIDGFKSINDTIGQEAGDELLRQVGQRLKDAAVPEVKPSLARLGADQFAIITADAESEARLAERIEAVRQKCFGRPFLVANSELRISVKTGIALFPDNGTDSRTLFKNAEAALKKAKADGEPWLFFTHQMTQQVASKLRLTNNLRRALERQEFVLHYQPKISLATGCVEGVEALIRWNDPLSGTQVPPMQFIPLLEETGLITEVGAWALGQAVRDHRLWSEAGTAPPRVAVNVSAIQLRRRDFVRTVESAIASGLVPGGLDLEITESLIMQDFEGNIDKLNALRDMGVNIAIDDFGTGYSSLAYLARLPVASLKIDRSFVITMLAEANVRTLVNTIVSLAHSFRLTVVAEGVDREEQAAALRGIGCDQMQGYLFSKPLPARDIPALLALGEGARPLR